MVVVVVAVVAVFFLSRSFSLLLFLAQPSLTLPLPSTIKADSIASYPCPVCGACFHTRRESALHRSSRPRPLDTKGWTCDHDYCAGRRFRCEQEYRGHLRANHGVHKCIDCALEFDASQHLLNHIQSTRQHRSPWFIPLQTAVTSFSMEFLSPYHLHAPSPPTPIQCQIRIASRISSGYHFINKMICPSRTSLFLMLTWMMKSNCVAS